MTDGSPPRRPAQRWPRCRSNRVSATTRMPRPSAACCPRSTTNSSAAPPPCRNARLCVRAAGAADTAAWPLGARHWAPNCNGKGPAPTARWQSGATPHASPCQACWECWRRERPTCRSTLACLRLAWPRSSLTPVARTSSWPAQKIGFLDQTSTKTIKRDESLAAPHLPSRLPIQF